ncbi:uncharacterized protein J7T54_003364 [Emericellopsis cladophorae]|uniref:Amidohydrolase-related domain-containing protein n=1 Tax=Emericellopsis cladophorae TaxID=2686198 RepID=A0A9P9XVM9_9HYPO|nr:uncharacterized protein J7T54_003364 [Emericellopsis cladophorae]KAI6778585.1 hypothetical protein J7T54_003364 [Emericellopsis cladophorae]
MTVRRIIPSDPVTSESSTDPFALPSQRRYLLVNARVVEPLYSSVTDLTCVRLADGLIHSIGPHVSPQDGDTVINLQGKYLCPGLMDCHVHLAAVPNGQSFNLTADDVGVSLLRQPWVCEQMIKRGFTTVRDTGGASLALKEAIEAGVFPGPRVISSGKALSQTGGHGDVRSAHQCCSSGILSTVVDGVAECTRAARENLRTGADFIKIMASGGVASPTDKLTDTQFTSGEVQTIVEVAESCGTYVTAHAYTPAAIRHAADNGVRGIEHGNLLDRPTAKHMSKLGITLTPTLVTYEAMGMDRYKDFLPPANQAKNKVVLEKGLEAMRIAHEEGVLICHGSDLLGPLQVEQSNEFTIRKRVLSDGEVLKGATINAARLIGRDDLGQIKDGFVADVLVLEKNPLEDVSVLSDWETTVKTVVKEGRVLVSRWDGWLVDVRGAITG